MNDLISVNRLGVGHSCTTATFSDWTSIPFSDRTWPRKAARFWNRTHFPCNFKLAARSRSNASQTLCTWLSKSFENTMMSSKYTRQLSYVSPQSTRSINLWKTEGAQVSPNDRGGPSRFYIPNFFRIRSAVSPAIKHLWENANTAWKCL